MQVQLYGDPFACLQFDRAIRCAVNACCAKAAFLAGGFLRIQQFLIIQQFQIQVVEGKFTTIFLGNVNLERKEAHFFDIDGFIQRQDAITFLTLFTDGLRIRIACVPVKDLFGILPGTLLGVCSQLENVVAFV